MRVLFDLASAARARGNKSLAIDKSVSLLRSRDLELQVTK